MSEEQLSLQELGERLRRLREEQGYSIQEVAEGIRVRDIFIQAIEEGRIDDLPSTVYARGFIRNYLSFLKVDELWDSYREVLPPVKSVDVASSVGTYAPPPKGFKRVPRWGLYVLVVVLVISGYYSWNKREAIREAFTRTHDTQTVTEEAQNDGETLISGDQLNLALVTTSDEVSPDVPSADPALSPDETPAATVASPDSADRVRSGDMAWLDQIDGEREQPRQEEQQEKTLTIRCTGRCWTRVRQGEEQLYVGTLEEGDTRSFPMDAVLSLRLGNAGVIVANWEGRDPEPLGYDGEVATVRIYPDGTIEKD
ncbi:MAG: DUF4115 domain-containing protein [Synergistales bacterium]|nr:DUF4115 domain-containing protein [Synergistales bacterium]